MRYKYAALLTLILMAIVVVPIFLTWRQMRQEQLNRALIAAVDRNDTYAVRKLLQQGADPNAPTGWSEEMTLDDMGH